MQRRAPLISALGAEFTRTASPHFSSGLRVHKDARPPPPHFNAGRPRDAGSTRHPNPPFQREAPPRPRSAGTPAPPLKRGPESARTPTPPHFSAGRLPGPDQQGPPLFHLSAGLPRVAGSTRRTPPPISARGAPGPGPQGRSRMRPLPPGVRERGCGAPLALRFESRRSWHEGICRSLRRSSVKGACLTARGAEVLPI